MIFVPIVRYVIASMTGLVMLFSVTCHAFDNDYNHGSGCKINRLKLCGERCSGTNFMMHLLHANFPELQPTGLQQFGHKHFMWWYGTTDFTKLKPLKFGYDAVTLENSSDCLFVVVVRDPYDWLRSFYITPHMVHRDLLTSGFSHFLRSEWKLMEDNYHPLDGFYNEIDNYNPWTQKPFANVLEMRKYKILNYLTLGEIVENYVIVRYEDVSADPQAFIAFIADKYQLRKKDIFVPITTLKGSHIPYVPRVYFPFSEEDLTFINENIDWDVEALVGHFMRKD